MDYARRPAAYRASPGITYIPHSHMRNFIIYVICVLCSPSLEIVTRTTYWHTKIFVASIRGGVKLCRKSEGLTYENTENRYPRRTIRPKIDPLEYVLPNAERKPCSKVSGIYPVFRNDNVQQTASLLRTEKS